MKKLMVLFMVTLLAVAFYCPNLWAGDDVIATTVTLDAIYEVALAPDVWDIGAQALEHVTAFVTFTATVGNIATKLQIKAADGDGGWSLGTVGADEFRLEVEDPVLDLTTEDQVLGASVTEYEDLGFALKYHMPSSDTLGATVAQGFDVTVTAGAVD